MACSPLAPFLGSGLLPKNAATHWIYFAAVLDRKLGHLTSSVWGTQGTGHMCWPGAHGQRLKLSYSLEAD